MPPTLLILTVLGSILFGVATPTESASLGALGSIIIAMTRGKFNFETLNDVCIQSIKINSMVFFVLIGASLFSLVFSYILPTILVIGMVIQELGL